MKHTSTDTITHPTDEDLEHLESCARCRARVTTDVDLKATRERTMTEVAAMTVFADSGRTPRPVWKQPWATAVVAATLVVLAFVPLGWLVWERGIVAEAPPGNTTPVIPAGGETSFEMAFTVGEDIVGRLIWESPTRYEALRGDLNADTATYTYSFYMSGTEVDVDDPRNNFFDFDASRESPSPADSMTDRAIPWSVLVNEPTTDDLWAWLAGATVRYEPTVPTHPDAASAVTGGGFTLEMSEQSVPVLWDGPGLNGSRSQTCCTAGSVRTRSVEMKSATPAFPSTTPCTLPRTQHPNSGPCLPTAS